MSIQSLLRRAGLRAAAITAASALVLVGVANSASAHVTVSSPDAKPGGYAKLVFRVPSESDTASTTKLVVALPKDHPFASVGAQVKDGWKVVKTKEKLASPVKIGDVTLTEAITTVTWTAEAGGVPPNDFDEFALSVGKIPEGVDSLNFPAVQTYGDGEVVRWEQVAKDAADKPEHPGSTGAEVVVKSPGGTNVSTGSPQVVDANVTQPLGALTEAGRYQVDARIVSADGHPVTVTASFSVTHPGHVTGQPAATASGSFLAI